MEGAPVPEGGGDGVSRRDGQLEDGHPRPAWHSSAVARAIPEAPPTTTAFLPAISMWSSFVGSRRVVFVGLVGLWVVGIELLGSATESATGISTRN